ncbi:unnamed protein product [Mesocestoides corti]|uniref:Uncharacterized protein n=1 Tax=Mesocestoides corti TaxID=53468 RepID=A0A0R3U5P1_MESCO|nr:unnamed protein product [Mesocestoides corti]
MAASTAASNHSVHGACRVLPNTAVAHNEVALFIFAVPKGTTSQDLFVSPFYRTLRNIIAKRCQCELAVFDGNTMTQTCVSSPKTAANRVRNANGNASIGPEVQNESATLSISIPNTFEQALLARGNWLVQVNYMTEPSEHHLFLKLINDFATKLHNSGGFKRGVGSPLLNQGFKYITLVELTHAKFRQMSHCDSLVSSQQRMEENQPISRLPPRLRKQNPEGDWKELQENTNLQKLRELQLRERWNGRRHTILRNGRRQFDTPLKADDKRECVASAEEDELKQNDLGESNGNYTVENGRGGKQFYSAYAEEELNSRGQGKYAKEVQQIDPKHHQEERPQKEASIDTRDREEAVLYRRKTEHPLSEDQDPNRGGQNPAQNTDQKLLLEGRDFIDERDRRDWRIEQQKSGEVRSSISESENCSAIFPHLESFDRRSVDAEENENASEPIEGKS